MKIDYSNKQLIITLYNADDVDCIYDALTQIEKFLCTKLKVDDSDFEDFNELHVDVDDYYEYQSFKRLIYNYTTI